jgi:hypothetical protein
MHTITISVPESFVVTSRGVDCTIDVTKLSAEIAGNLFEHGLTQKVADAASNAKAIADENNSSVEEVTATLMGKAADSLLAGEWTRRNAGAGVSEETRVQRSVMKAAMKAQLGGKSPEWKAFEGLSDDEQNAKLDANFADNEKVLAPIVAEKIAALAAARETKAKLAKSVKINLK